MAYRYETTSPEGFIQQLVTNYVPHGYWFYVTGWVPEGKNPALVDRKLTEKYGVCISRQARARRKAAGHANLHYLRYERFFVLIGTHGSHAFFAEESASIRDIRKIPLRFGGHSITYRPGGFRRKDGDGVALRDDKWHSRVQISRDRYLDLKRYFLDIACRASAQAIGRKFFNLPYEPYARVRQQLLNLLRFVNKRRQAAGIAKIPPSVICYQRRIVRPFDDVTYSD